MYADPNLGCSGTMQCLRRRSRVDNEIEGAFNLVCYDTNHPLSLVEGFCLRGLNVLRNTGMFRKSDSFR